MQSSNACHQHVCCLFLYFIYRERQLKRNQAARLQFALSSPLPAGNLIKTFSSVQLPAAFYCVHLIRTTISFAFFHCNSNHSSVAHQQSNKNETCRNRRCESTRNYTQKRFKWNQKSFFPREIERKRKLTIFRGQQLFLGEKRMWNVKLFPLKRESKIEAKCNNNQTKLLFKHITNHNRNFSYLFFSFYFFPHSNWIEFLFIKKQSFIVCRFQSIWSW